MTQVTAPYSAARRRPVKELSPAMNGYLDLLERSLQQIYRRVGGESDAVSNSQSAIPYADIFTDETFPYKEVSANYETEGDEFLEVTAACTITLSEAGHVYIYVNTSGDVSVTDGVGTDILTEQYTVLSYRYINETEGWTRGA